MRSTNKYNLRTYKHGEYIIQIVRNPLDKFLECYICRLDVCISLMMSASGKHSIENFCDQIKVNIDMLIKLYEKEVKHF